MWSAFDQALSLYCAYKNSTIVGGGWGGGGGGGGVCVRGDHKLHTMGVGWGMIMGNIYGDRYKMHLRERTWRMLEYKLHFLCYLSMRSL
jgi:hypothetical protein